jgi:hypothetical protein
MRSGKAIVERRGRAFHGRRGLTYRASRIGSRSRCSHPPHSGRVVALAAIRAARAVELQRLGQIAVAGGRRVRQQAGRIHDSSSDDGRPMSERFGGWQ